MLLRMTMRVMHRAPPPVPRTTRTMHIKAGASPAAARPADASASLPDGASGEDRLPQLAAAIGEPARARMLCALLDGHARTATELAVAGEIAASTASGHLSRLVKQGLLTGLSQGRHRYFRLSGAAVAQALESLLVIAGTPRAGFTPSTPQRLRAARTCYDHMAGAYAVTWHDHFLAQGWLLAGGDGYILSPAGQRALAELGLDFSTPGKTRRLACPCMDWSERRPHLAGALGAAFLELALRKRWVVRGLDSRALQVTPKGDRQLAETQGRPATASTAQ